VSDSPGTPHQVLDASMLALMDALTLAVMLLTLADEWRDRLGSWSERHTQARERD